MRSNLQIKVGTYTGNNTDNTNITGVGFRPQLVIIKGGAQISHLLTNTMGRDASAYMVGGSANGANILQELLADGFQVGGSALSNTNATTYYYIAIRGLAAQTYFKTGKYIGDGADNRNVTAAGIRFTPEILLIKGNTAQQASIRLPNHVGDNCSTWSNSTGGSNIIQNLQSNGFQLGTNARVNSAGVDYHFFAMRQLAGAIKAGSFTGDGVDGKAITGVGFQPDAIILKNESTSDPAVLRTSDMAGDLSASLTSAAPTTGLIKSVTSDGFTVGSNAAVNGNGNTISWLALKAGSFNAPISRSVA